MPVSSQEELFDVVDGEDRVLRQEQRGIVHRERLFHRAVHVFVLNAAGQLFLQRRSFTKDSAPGKWVSSCSGHVDSGEDYDEAARRELAEEIGLREPGHLRPVFKEKPCAPTGNEFVWVYDCTSEGPFELDRDEVIEGQWIERDALQHWLDESPRDFAWSFCHLWAKYCAAGSK
ncbi:MAG: NUDIX hydrolase [Opitutales bacterium]